MKNIKWKIQPVAKPTSHFENIKKVPPVVDHNISKYNVI